MTAWLHDRGQVHCDVKPENVCLSMGRGYVIDFGTLCGVSDAAVRISHTPKYEPREVIEGRSVSEKRDIFQLGWVLRHLLSKWKGREWIDPEWAKDDIAQMMSSDPAERPTAAALLAPDSWIRTIARGRDRAGPRASGA
jgi:serine/threonine protein kinase